MKTNQSQSARERWMNWLAVLVLISLGIVWPPLFADTASPSAEGAGRDIAAVTQPSVARPLAAREAAASEGAQKALMPVSSRPMES